MSGADLGRTDHLGEALEAGARTMVAFTRRRENRRITGLVVLFFVTMLVYTPFRSTNDLKNGFLGPTRHLLDGDAGVFTEASVNSYSPFFYAVMTPLAQLSDAAANVVWGLVNTILYLAVNVLIIAIIGRAFPSRKKFSCFVAPLLTLPLLADNLYLGQSNIFTFFFTVAALFVYQRRQDVRAGLLLSVAVAFKLMPAIFALHFLARRRWRALAGLSIGTAACLLLVPSLVFGPARNLEYVREWAALTVVPFVSGESVRTRTVGWQDTNQSLEAAMVRHLTPWGLERYGGLHERLDPGVLTEGQARTLATAFRLALAGLLAVLVVRGGRRERFPFEVSLFFLAMMFVSPVAWNSHYIVLLIPFSVAVNEILNLPRDAPGRRLLFWTVAGSAGVAAFNSFRSLQSYSLLFLGSLLLFAGLLIYTIRNYPGAPSYGWWDERPAEGAR